MESIRRLKSGYNRQVLFYYTTKSIILKKPLVILLLIALVLFAVDRVAAYLYIPKPGATEITIYTTQWCPYCKALRNTLNQYKIPFTEHDTEKSIQGVLGFWALRARGVPVSVIGEEIIYGYDGQKITDALVSSGYDIPASWDN